MFTNETAKQIEQAWLDGDSDECCRIVQALAKELNVSPNHLYALFTNLQIAVS